MEEKIISVIVAIYNVEKYVDFCIKSIVNQTYKNIEIILVDDGSTDNSHSICDDWVKKDNRIKVIHKPNGGLSDARNAGLDIMTGEYVTFIDGDDYIDSRYIEVLYNNLVKNNVQVSQVDFCYEDKPKREQITEITIDSKEACKNYYLSLYPMINISACAKLYSRSIINEIRFPVGKIHEDQFFTPNVVYNAEGISLSNEQLYCYVKRDGSIMHSVFSKKRWDNIWAVDQCINVYKQNGDKELVRAANHYKKKVHAKFVIQAYKDNKTNEILNEYKMPLVKAKIIFFIYLSKIEKRDKLLYPFAVLKSRLKK